MQAAIRTILDKIGEIPTNIEVLDARADLYEAGLSSYGTVELMVALEQAFGIEFPDHLLTRDTFACINSIASTVASLLKAGQEHGPAKAVPQNGQPEVFSLAAAPFADGPVP